MTSKEAAVKTIQELPEHATWEDIQERINSVAGVRRGLQELDEGKGILHEQVREEFRGTPATSTKEPSGSFPAESQESLHGFP